jgi:hypothetical protein
VKIENMDKAAATIMKRPIALTVVAVLLFLMGLFQHKINSPTQSVSM